MMQRVSYDTIKRRAGSGLIPPNRRQWNYEHAGLNVRDELALAPEEALDPLKAFGLVPNAQVLPHGRVPAADSFLDYFRTDGIAHWSGMSVSAEGMYFIVYNDAHPANRVRTTLMEEFFHIRFGHEQSKVRVYGTGGQLRTFDAGVEEEAYHSGAAALLPYKPLHSMLASGKTVAQIASHFHVSEQLVTFRAKVTRCYSWSRRRN